ncbi:MAG: MazG nucleotide pyrophosphohydrolase domain-containing protein [Sedimentisphaerales bacterium]
MNSKQMEDKAWKLLVCARTVCKPFLWLRDSDSPQRLASELVASLREALTTVVLFPDALSALKHKLFLIYEHALEKPFLVGIGASPYASRLGERTAKCGLLAAVEYARDHKQEFSSFAETACSCNPLDWGQLFDVAYKFIDCLDWGEFVLENARGQAACLALECVELLEAVQKKGGDEVKKEVGDVFYNLMAFCLSVRIQARHLALTSGPT